MGRNHDWSIAEDRGDRNPCGRRRRGICWSGQGGVDLPGDVALETSDDLTFAAAFGGAAFDVGAGTTRGASTWTAGWAICGSRFHERSAPRRLPRCQMRTCRCAPWPRSSASSLFAEGRGPRAVAGQDPDDATPPIPAWSGGDACRELPYGATVAAVAREDLGDAVKRAVCVVDELAVLPELVDEIEVAGCRSARTG